MEMWDLFDKMRRPLSRTHLRGTPLNPNEYHLVVEIWTVNSNKEILITLRDPHKEKYPNQWEITGSSAIAGETSRQAAVRELQEETGITAKEDELIFLGTTQGRSHFVDAYLLHRDIAIPELTLQEGETVDAKWISLDQLNAMIENHSLVIPTGKQLETFKNYF